MLYFFIFGQNQLMSENRTAREIVHTLPDRFKPDAAEGIELIFHFNLEGDSGGEFTVSIVDQKCKVEDGLHGVPDCVMTTKASIYEEIEQGKTNPQMAFMMGKIKISAIGEMLKFTNLFERSNAGQ